MDTSKPTIASYSILLAAYGVVIAYYLLVYPGHFGYDDMQYAQIAHDVLRGQIDYSDHYYYRSPIIYGTALSYCLFGINDWASAFPALLMMFLLLWLVFRVARPWGLTAVAVALSMTVLGHWLLYYSNQLMPDIYLAFGVLGVLGTIHHYKYRPRRHGTVYYALAFTVFLLFAFLSKGVVILVLPLLAYLFLSDLFYRRDQSFWWLSVLQGGVAMAFYFGLTWWVTGSPWSRFGAISANSYLNPCSYDQQPVELLLGRIGYQFFEMLAEQGAFFGFVLVLAAVHYRDIPRYLRLETPAHYWALSAILLLLSSNFMTVSLDSYSPLCLDPRHYLFLTPVVAIACAPVIDGFLAKREAALRIVLGLALLTAYTYWQGKAILGTHQFWLLLLFGTCALMGTGRWRRAAFWLGFLAILISINYPTARYLRSIQYRDIRSFVLERLVDKQEACTVLTDPVQKRIGYYYTGFDPTHPVQFVSYTDSSAMQVMPSSTPTYLLKIWHTQFLAGLSYDDLPLYVRTPDSIGAQRVVRDDDLNISLYRLPEATTMRQRDTIFRSRTGFEEATAYWQINPAHLQGRVVYRGTKALQLNSESPDALVVPVDSLMRDGASQIVVSVALNIYLEQADEPAVCIVLEDQNGVYQQYRKPIGKQVKAFTHWWPASCEAAFPVADLRPGAHLKFFVSATEGSSGYVDDLEVVVHYRKKW